MRTLFPLLAILVSTNVFAQTDAQDVTDDQVAFYQLGMETGCKDAGRRKNDPPEKVEAFCSCMMKTLKEEISFVEWQKAYWFSRNRRDREEMQVVGPHIQKVQSCRANPL